MSPRVVTVSLRPFGLALVLVSAATLAPLPAAAQQPPPPGQPASAPAQPATPAQPVGAPASPAGPAVPLARPLGAGDGASGDPHWSVPDETPDLFQRKKRFIIAGASIFGLAYYGSLAASTVGITRNNQGSKEYIPGLIPFVGPFITAVSRAIPNANQTEGDMAGTGFYLGLGALQLLGTGLFIAGLRMPTGTPPSPCRDRISSALYSPAAAGSDTPPYRPCSPVSVSLQPIVTPTFAGGGVTGTF